MICKKTVYALTFICASLQNVQVYASSGAPALTAVQEESKAHCEKYHSSCTQNGDVFYGVSDGKMTIYGPESASEATISGFSEKSKIPSSVREIEVIGNVTQIASSAFENQDSGSDNAKALITKITLPDSETTIGSRAFLQFYNLTDLDLGGATSIGTRAFARVFNLTNLVIPDGAVIEEEAFFDSITSSVTASAEQLEAYLTAGGLLTPDENGKVNIICTSGDCNTAIRTYFENSNSDAYAVGRNPAGVCLYINETHTYTESKHFSCTDEDTAADLRQRYIDTILSSLVISRPSSGDEQELPEGCLEMGNNRCVTCDNEHLEKNGSCVLKSEGCGENYKQIENWCNRTRYTPVEAAEILNDNDNSIVITFKLGGK